jgi:hypothetical protein
MISLLKLGSKPPFGLFYGLCRAFLKFDDGKYTLIGMIAQTEGAASKIHGVTESVG